MAGDPTVIRFIIFSLIHCHCEEDTVFAHSDEAISTSLRQFNDLFHLRDDLIRFHQLSKPVQLFNMHS